jgi:hypothetical protein
MKTPVNICEVYLPPAQAAGWGIKVRAKPGAALKNLLRMLKNGLPSQGMGR